MINVLYVSCHLPIKLRLLNKEYLIFIAYVMVWGNSVLHPIRKYQEINITSGFLDQMLTKLFLQNLKSTAWPTWRHSIWYRLSHVVSEWRYTTTTLQSNSQTSPRLKISTQMNRSWRTYCLAWTHLSFKSIRFYLWRHAKAIFISTHCNRVCSMCTHTRGLSTDSTYALNIRKNATLPDTPTATTHWEGW